MLQFEVYFIVSVDKMSSDEEPEEGARTDLEKVGMFRDGPYDTDVTLFRPDIKGMRRK